MIWIKLRLKRHFITRRVLQLLSQTCCFGKVQQNELPNLHFKVISMLTLFNQFICFHLFTNLLIKWFNDTLNIPTRENKSYVNSGNSPIHWRVSSMDWKTSSGGGEVGKNGRSLEPGDDILTTTHMLVSGIFRQITTFVVVLDISDT